LKTLFLNMKMMTRRLSTSLLICIFVAIITVFLGIYPQLIRETDEELTRTYNSVDVNCWIINKSDYSKPWISHGILSKLLESGLVDTYYAYTYGYVNYFQKDEWIELTGATDAPSDERMKLFRDRIYMESELIDYIYGVNCKDAHGACSRLCDQTMWLEGYDESCLSGDELVCMLPSHTGYMLGDYIPMKITLTSGDDSTKSIRGEYELWFQVVGLYPAQDVSENTLGGYCPIEALNKNLNGVAGIRSLTFYPSDNRRLEELKAYLTELELNGVNTLRAIVDDRVLQGTVAPLESNLALLKNLYLVFFGAVIAIGFFLCFLLARGRKPEYAVMRMLGESSLQVTFKALLEQFVLCLAGILLGALLLFLAGQGHADPATCGIILICYTFGAALAVLLTVRVNVMEILRDKE